jgi:NAD-dependent dihydropyrimidine dehydrogenase PreA subunit
LKVEKTKTYLRTCGLLFNCSPAQINEGGIRDFQFIPRRSKVRNSTMNKIVLIDENLCIGCGKCVKLCPKKILFIDKTTGKCKVTDETQCDKRRGCERVCPTSAIKIN